MCTCTYAHAYMHTSTCSFIIPGTSEDVTTSDLLPQCPRIVDPVNPANNVYLSGVGKNYDAVDDQEKWRMLREKISKIDITLTAEIIVITREQCHLLLLLVSLVVCDVTLISAR